MSDTIIKVENLSKKYVIGHQQESRSNYTSLRDVISNSAKSLIQKIKHPTKSSSNKYEDFWALNDVSFEIKRGEAVGIIGRNGAGKSTLLKILSRITEPTQGRVSIKGKVASLLEVGTGFHPELTGRENIYLNGAILGMSRVEIKKKFDEIVDFAEVEKFLDTPVKRYSSGMYVRLAFAVAAHLEPEILVVDEVLAVGDAAFQKKCLGKMGDVAEKEGRTVLFVSHNMGAISSLCSKGILLHQGKAIVNSDIQQAISSYFQNSCRFDNCESLINHPNRAKECKEWLTAFTLDTKDGIAYYGDKLKATIAYNFAKSIAVPQFVIIVNKTSGEKAFTLISDYQNNDIQLPLCGKGEVVCYIPFLPLLPGNYTVSLKLWEPGQKLDDIENILALKVDWLNRKHGQFSWNTDMGVIYVDANWQLKKEKILNQ